MKVSTMSIHPTLLRSGLAVALAIGALTVLNVRAHAANLDPITVSAPVVKTIGRDMVTEGSIEDITVTAHIAVDAETLRNDSGVVLLKDRVLEAAYKVCYAADPFSFGDTDCVREAVKSAQPQVAAAITHARSVSVMQ